MRLTRPIFQCALIALVCGLTLSLLSTAAGAQSPPVYVSGAPPSGTSCNSGVTLCSIYISSNFSTPLLTMPAANFESLAIGSDNATVDVDSAGNAKYAFFLFACDTSGNTIIRIAFKPGAPATPAGTETVYNSIVAVPGLVPVCGRSSSAGDFYVTNKSGPGLFVFSGVANVAFGTLSPSRPASVTLSPNFPGTMTGQATTQKYVGDLLLVDSADNEVLRSPYGTTPPFPMGTVPPFTTLSVFTNTNLNVPAGITRVSTGDVFVANTVLKIHGATFAPVAHFDRSGNVANSSCPVLSFSQPTKELPAYLASTPTDQIPTAAPNTLITDTIYLVTASGNSGTLWTWNSNSAPGNCNLSIAASSKVQLSGVAIPPAPVTLNLPVTATMASPTATTFLFNSNLFQLTANGCTASVTAYPLSLATVNSMINLARLAGGDMNASPPYPAPLIPPALANPATPAANLGDEGFEIAYVAHWFFRANPPPPPPPSCTSVFADGGFLTGFANFVDASQSTNPRAVQCDNSDPSTEPTLPSAGSGVTTTCGASSPIGIYPIGGPIAGDIVYHSNSVFAMVNEATNTTVEQGQFCGFEPKLINTTDPAQAASFSKSTSTVNVKFKLANLTAGGDCKSGQFIDDAVALISVARLADASGPFQTINVQANSSDLDVAPLFAKPNGGNTQQYAFTLNIPNIFAQGGLGTYTITVSFDSNNDTEHTIVFNITN